MNDEKLTKKLGGGEKDKSPLNKTSPYNVEKGQMQPNSALAGLPYNVEKGQL